MKGKFLLFAAVLCFHVFINSCDSEQPIIEYIKAYDTIQVSDTVIVPDTVMVSDTIQLCDTIQVRDTLTVCDTLMVCDTIMVRDTIQISDTIKVCDTIQVSDTVVVRDIIEIRDTVVVYENIEECVVEEFDIENAGTRKFLEEVDYTADTAYTVSYVNTYRKTYSANDKPLPVKISWDGESEYRVVISTSPGFSNPLVVQGTSSQVDIYNLIPDQKYYYKILDSNDKILKVGCFRPVGPLRMIKGVADNVRDLGGWKVDGGHIAYGKIYRGAKLSSKSSAKDIFLNQLGISVDMDLRGIKSSESTVGPVIDEAEYVKFPVEKNMGRGTGNTQEVYQQAIRAVIGYLEEGKVVYFHCAGGADRTGTLAFLIEALVGMSESDLSKDYELTTFDGSNKRFRNYRATEDETHILYELITYLRKFGDFKTQTINELVENWATTRHSPDVDPLTPEEIALLRKYLIVKD